MALSFVSLVCMLDGLDEFFFHDHGREVHPPRLVLAAAALTLTDRIGKAELGVGDAVDALEEFLLEAFWDVLGFGGHVTRDWGLLSWEPERGLEKFMKMERS